MALCHDLTRVKDRDGKEFLTGPSQDELCLLEMAEAKNSKAIGRFIDRDSATFTIEIDGRIETYKNIKFFDFDSARKMMTRIV